MYAHVILTTASQQIDKIFHYGIPNHLQDKTKIGSQVSIPFGKGQRVGYVVGFSEKAAGNFKIKDILEVLSPKPLFNEKQLELAKWIAKYYGSFQITALRLIMPPGTKAKENRKTSNVKRLNVTSNVNDNRYVQSLPKTLTEEQNDALNKS